MAGKRQLVLIRPDPDDDAGIATVALGAIDEIVDKLSLFNTAPDGSAARSLGTKVLYGPGYIVELPTAQDTINQALVNVNDDETAWPVLSRLCKKYDWKMQDAKTGRIFG
jgi:hypothetical protein